MTDLPATAYDWPLGRPVLLGRRWRVAAVGVLGLGFSAAAIAIGARANRDPMWLFMIAEAAGLSFQISGLFLWSRAEAGWVGPVMFACGTSWYLGNLQYLGNPVLFAVGYWLYYLDLVLFCHLVLLYPAGRLRRARTDVWILAIAYCSYLTLQGMRYLFEHQQGPIGWQEPLPNSLLANLLSGIAIAFAVMVVFRLTRRRWLRSRPTRPSHRIVWYVLATNGIIVVLNAAGSIAGIDRRIQTALFFSYGISLAFLPVAFTLGVLRERLLIADLVEVLEKAIDLPTVTSVVKTKLGDPKFQIGLWSPAAGTYIGDHGAVFTPPAPTGELEVRQETWNGEPLAVLVFDAALVDQPKLTSGMLAVTRLALVRIRQINDLRAQHERVLTAVFNERDHIASRLHDSVQYSILALAALADSVTDTLRQSPGTPPETLIMISNLKKGALEASEELRKTAQGIFPAILITRGLAAAVEEMAIRSPIPVFVELPRQRFRRIVEATAYFAVAGALANAIKYSRSATVLIDGQVDEDKLTITVEDDGIGGAKFIPGRGLSASAEHINALRGRMTLHSADGHGTVVTMELPCES